MPKETVVGSS
jgi:hypothetical protein